MNSVENFEKLKSVYTAASENQFGLFLGSGVNGGQWSKLHPACSSWEKLLELLDASINGKNPQLPVIKQDCSDWRDIAQRLLAKTNRTKYINMIDRVLYKDIWHDQSKRISRSRKHKVLAWTVFSQMPTLRAVVCFSAAIRDPDKKRSVRNNPKLGCILTTNYDFFLGAAWPRYTSMAKCWKICTWRSGKKKNSESKNIIYLHGYLPYSRKGIKDLIITRNDYKRDYQPSGFAFCQLKKALNEHNMIFIGFSFSDTDICNMLKEETQNKQHFAFIHERESKTIERAGESKVNVITIKGYQEIPEKLSMLYCEGLEKSELYRTDLDQYRYWQKLWNSQLPRKKSETLL